MQLTPAVSCLAYAVTTLQQVKYRCHRLAYNSPRYANHQIRRQKSRESNLRHGRVLFSQLRLNRLRSVLFRRRGGFCEFENGKLPLAFPWPCPENRSSNAEYWNVKVGADTTTTGCWLNWKCALAERFLCPVTVFFIHALPCSRRYFAQNSRRVVVQLKNNSGDGHPSGVFSLKI